LLIPARVDVPQDRLPIVNWLIIAGTIAVFVWQMFSINERTAQLPAKTREYENKSVEDMVKEFGVKDNELKEIEKSVEKPTRIMEDGGLFKKAGEREQFKDGLIKEVILRQYYVWGEIKPYMLDGLRLKGLFGHMWLHGGFLHIIGNMLFLWIFGNAICAKIGNLRYIPVYIGMGLIAGISHLMFVGGSMLGASGAINGIVGMFLVFFPQNEITCYFIFLIIFRPIIKEFSVSSAWIILFWLAFDIWGAMKGGGGVAYFAHLGGFAGGVVLAILMLKFKMVTMERYEKSLLQIIEEYRHPAPAEVTPSSQYYDYLSETAKERPELPLVPIAAVPFEPKTISTFAPPAQPQAIPLEPQKPKDEFIRFACTCGKRLKMPAKYAGKTGKCPQCNGRLKIPDR
jgi:membrane associated rhomboid family serine protease